MAEQRLGSSARQPEAVKLEVRRFKSGNKIRVRSLTDSYGGLFVHWAGQHGGLCLGDRVCRLCPHKARQWQGYFAAEWFDERNRLWMPCVFEMTANAELDVRGRFARGSVWDFSKPKQIDGKNPPMSATFLEQLDPEKLRGGFDIAPTMRRCMNVQSLDLSHENPLEPRVFLEPSVDALGAPLTAAERLEREKANAMSPEQWETFRKARQELFGSTNGKRV